MFECPQGVVEGAGLRWADAQRERLRFGRAAEEPMMILNNHAPPQ